MFNTTDMTTLPHRLRALKAILGTDSPEVRGWAPAVQQEAQKVVNAMIAEIERLRAEVAGLREDAERLDFLLHKLPGDSLRYVLGELSDTSDEAEFRAAIDAARKGEA